MKFKKITFENYRCFLNGTIEFPTTKDKNMSVLIAPNGGGKTETLFAFWWTLYEFDFSKLTNKENTPYALNSELYRELENSEVDTVKHCVVSIEFEHENVVYYLSKRCEYKRTEKQIRVEEYKTLSKYKANGELSLPERDPDKINKVLNRIIPRQILYGIIFDGERMQKLNAPDENSITAIRGVINDITNVELLERSALYFDDIKKKINKKMRNAAKRSQATTLVDLIIEIANDEKQLKEANKALKMYQEEYEKIAYRLDVISSELAKNKEVKEIESKRKLHRLTLSGLEKNLESYYKSFSDIMVDAYLMNSDTLFKNVEEIIDKYDVPEGLTVNAVKSILSSHNHKCICGREFDQEAINTLNTLIGLLPPDNINSTLKEIIRGLRLREKDVRKEAKDAFLKIQSCEHDIKSEKEIIASLSSQIISLEPTGSDAEKASQLEAENVNLESRKMILNEQIPNTKEKIKDLTSKLEKLKNLRNEIETIDSESKTMNKQLRFIEKSIDALSKIKEVNKDTALSEINELLRKAYDRLSEDSDRGRQIRIIQYNESKKYQIAVYMKSNYDALLEQWKSSGVYQRKIEQGLTDKEIGEEIIVKCIDSNSTGQSKINTFAFVKAILDYSNSPKKDDGIEIAKEYPLLIDAPFGDIASQNLVKSSTELHNFAHQVILMIDEDKYNSLRKAFDPFICSKYMFEKAIDTNYSVIRKVSV